MSRPYDIIGPWSELKLDIIKKYAAAYSKILSANNLYHIYIDAFAGSGINLSRMREEFIPGSPTNALLIEPQFREYHFIDLDYQKLRILEEISEDRDNVKIYYGDCNEILLKLIPSIEYNKYRRALCILDPYGLHLKWEIIKLAGEMKTVEIFLNFPLADINRNVLWQNPDRVSETQKLRLNNFWGDESWKEIAYKPSSKKTLFGDTVFYKVSNKEIADAFKDRLKNVAGFNYVPDPIPMHNTKNAIVYYLFFAAHRPVSEKIVNDIFNMYIKKWR